MKFIGRKTELKFLNEIISSNEFKAALIYGRRRVGKSELIKKALSNSKGKTIYYECKQVSEMTNVNNLKAIFKEKLNMSHVSFDDIDSILMYFFKEYGKENITLVLDEYTFLRDCVLGCDSIIQSLIDNNKDISNCKLILMGSYVDTMKSLTGYDNPLYGRFDRVIYLKPMNYLESSEFYPNFSNEDKVRIYSVFGGIPFYNQFVDDSKSVKENIINLVASPNSRLVNEVPENLQKEIGKITNANDAFEALAMGSSKYNDILADSHISGSPALADVLNKLVRMELVEKVTPINDPKNKKKTSYHIYDNFTLFYYRYIFKYRSQLNFLNEDEFYEKYIKEDFEEKYVPNRFEYLCKEYLILKNKSGKNDPSFYEIGKYYYDLPKEKKNGEFDIVTKDDNGYIFYEVKFKNKPLDNKTIKEEIKQVNGCGLDCYKYGFISRSGFKQKNMDNIIYIDLKDIYIS